MDKPLPKPVVSILYAFLDLLKSGLIPRTPFPSIRMVQSTYSSEAVGSLWEIKITRRMHSSRMRTARSLTVSRRILRTPPSNHAHPLATMHVPHNHACPLQPCIPPNNHACPPATTHAHPPATTHAPLPVTTYVPPQPHMSPWQPRTPHPCGQNHRHL